MKHRAETLAERFRRDVVGATVVEYGIVAALIAAAIIVSLTSVAQTVGGIADRLSTTFAQTTQS